MLKLQVSVKGMRSYLTTFLADSKMKVYVGKLERVEKLILYALSQVPIQEEATIQVQQSGDQWMVKVLLSGASTPTLIVEERTDGSGFSVSLPNKVLSHKPRSMLSPYHPPNRNLKSQLNTYPHGQ